MAPRMALKGGTALNAYHAPLPRVSVDIDINYIGELDWTRMREDKRVFEDRFVRIMSSSGCHQEYAPPKGCGKWRFGCRDIAGGGFATWFPKRNPSARCSGSVREDGSMGLQVGRTLFRQSRPTRVKSPLRVPPVVALAELAYHKGAGAGSRLQVTLSASKPSRRRNVGHRFYRNRGYSLKKVGPGHCARFIEGTFGQQRSISIRSMPRVPRSWVESASDRQSDFNRSQCGAARLPPRVQTHRSRKHERVKP